MCDKEVTEEQRNEEAKQIAINAWTPKCCDRRMLNMTAQDGLATFGIAEFWCETCSKSTDIEFGDLPMAMEADKLHDLRGDLFDLANSYAGDKTGNVAVFLHTACNEIRNAIDCLERGNPIEDVPTRLLAQRMGITEEVAEAIQPFLKR